MIGVVLKSQDGGTSTYPTWLHTSITAATESLNSSVMFTMVSDVTDTLFLRLPASHHEVVLHSSGISIPVVESFDDVIQLSMAENPEGSACLVRDQRILLIWTMAVETILPRARDLEKLLREELHLPIATIAPPGSRTSRSNTPSHVPGGRNRLWTIWHLLSRSVRRLGKQWVVS
jgi:hypothetical protein